MSKHVMTLKSGS